MNGLCVCTMFTPAIEGYASRVTKNLADYAALNGYAFRKEIRNDEDCERPPSWYKLPLIKKLAAEFDWVVWIDADAVVMNHAFKLESIVDSRYDLIWSEVLGRPCAGVFALHSNDRTHQFIERCWARVDLIGHKHWEQQAMIEECGTLSVNVNPRLLANHWKATGATYRPGDFLVHHGGNAAKETIADSLRQTSLAMDGRGEFPDLLNRHRLTGTGAEIGVDKGDFSHWILSRWGGRGIFLVDSWLPSNKDAKLPNAAEVMRKTGDDAVARLSTSNRAVIFRMDSLAAAAQIPDGSLDWVYIDADHSYEGVSADLKAWAPKVRTGGIVAGHDYCTRPDMHIDVERAVKEHVKDARANLRTTRSDKFPSWYYVKR